jgi:heavy metal translocating P-type ATPase
VPRPHAARLATLAERRFGLLAAAALTAILAGLALQLGGRQSAAEAVWAAATAGVLVPLTWSVARTVAGGRVGVDAIALVAMAGALALGELLAGAVVALMLTGGNALEAAAGRRARRALTELLESAPTVAHRRRAGEVEDVPIDVVAAGDVVAVLTGEVVPVDGVLATRRAVLDEAALTGESLPVPAAAGDAVPSGAVNVGPPFDVRATRPAAESAYAALVRLVEQAQAQRAPFTRLADRYAALLLPATLTLAGAAWALSGDPVRALAVVVVATPCPLILAAPIAFAAGISRAARRGIIVKGGGVIEGLGRARSVLLDKTGTLTAGEPHIAEVVVRDGLPEAEIVRLAASLDRLSPHVLARALVVDARARGLRLVLPEDVEEDPGSGIRGRVEGRDVAVGSTAWLAAHGFTGADAGVPDAAGRASVAVGVDGRAVGTLVMADRVRPDVQRLVGDLRAAGVRHVAMVTGDRREVAERLAAALRLDAVHAEQTPQDKLGVVRAVREDAALRPVVMVGDGVNDAPALAMADVGVAMGARGATASSETADVVLSVDDVGRVGEAVRIGRRSLRIATQSVVLGMGLSGVAMGFAAAGMIAPVAGALLQEAIDVAVILNALRALRDG